MSTHSFDETSETETPNEQASPGEAAADTQLELATRLELVEAENRRLRAEYARARKSTYRRTALTLAAVGLGALGGGFLFPAERAVFITLGAIGIFGGILTYYLTPGQFVAADVGERVYTAGARNLAALADALGLRSRHVYLPRGDSVRLFVPLSVAYELPRDADGPLVLEDDERGLLLEPTGALLYREFERTLSGGLAAEPAALATQLCDGLVEQFELATRATPELDPEANRITVAISNSAFGAIDRFDHPLPSFLATGLAAGLDQPVTVDVTRGDERADWLITCRVDDEDD